MSYSPIVFEAIITAQRRQWRVHITKRSKNDFTFIAWPELTRRERGLVDGIWRGSPFVPQTGFARSFRTCAEAATDACKKAKAER